MNTVAATHIETFPLIRRGKVRDVYDLGEHLLIVATDRVSAFDVVLTTPIPEKGKILTALSTFWFQRLESEVLNHFVTCNFQHFPRACEPYRDLLQGRSMIVQKAQPIMVECVVRGYLVGSGWKEYQQTGSVGGVQLPAGLQYGDRLPEPIFTPALKVHNGHDQNVSFEQLQNHYGETLAEQLRQRSLWLYHYAADYLAQRSLILVDTKFEFGFDAQHRLLLIDEVLTPDSSRFWRSADYEQGRRSAFFDKQVLRDYLGTLKEWDRQTPIELPSYVVRKMAKRYRQLFEMVTGMQWDTQSICD